MRKISVKFLIINFVILHFANLIAFAAACLIDMLSGFFFTQEQAFAQTALVCIASYAVFLFYLFTIIRKMPETSLSRRAFLAHEIVVYCIFLLIPTVCVSIYGVDSIGRFRFYLPNLAGAHCTANPIMGFLLQTVITSLVIAAAYASNRKRRAAYLAEEQRKRDEDEAYAQKLAEQEKEE